MEILEWYPDRSSLKKREKELVNEAFLSDPLCMNLIEGGEGMSSKLAKEIFSNNWKNPELRALMTKQTIQRNEKLHKEGKLPVPKWKGKSHSVETKKKFSEQRKGQGAGEKNSQFGTCFINKEGKNLRIKAERLDEYLSDGWLKGRKGRS